MKVRIRSERVVLGGGGEPLRVAPASILVEGNRIRSVDAAEPAKPEPGVERVELGDALVTPAFVNAHTHLAMAAYRGFVPPPALRGNVVEDTYFRLEQHLQPDDVRAFTAMGAYESLLAGVGCVWDHYYYADAVAEALAETGLSGVVAPTLQDVAGPGVDHLEEQLVATEHIHGSAALAERGIVAALGPHATDTVSSELWAVVRDTADRLNLPIHVHVAQSLEEYERSEDRYGCTPIARLGREGALDAGAGMLLVHCLFATESDLGLLSADRHALGFCPYSQVQFGFPAPWEAFRARGLPVVVGTDAPAGNDGTDVRRELRLAVWGGFFAVAQGPAAEAFRASRSVTAARFLWEARVERFDQLVESALPDAMLAMAWSAPGRLHPGLDLGVLRPGALANLLVWQADHPGLWPARDPLRALTMGDLVSAIDGMMVAGRWVGERGDFAGSLLRSTGYRDARAEADGRLKALLARAGLAP